MLRVRVPTPEQLEAGVEVDYVSFVDAGTHGPPALIAPGRANGENTRPTVQQDESVLYINNGADEAFAAVEIERLA